MNFIGSRVVCGIGWHDLDATERQALDRAEQFLPTLPGVAYFGFPWTNFMGCSGSTGDRGRLAAALHEKAITLKQYHTIVTVCRHPGLLDWQQLLADTGITHIFWSGANKDTIHLPDSPHIKIFPFPTAPLISPGLAARGCERSQLIARPWGPYSAALETGKFERDQEDASHIRNTSHSSLAEDTCQALTCSRFALFPGITTLDPAWLWTAVTCESIPVFIGEIPNLPGSRSLWEEATVQYLGDVDNIESYLDKLNRDATWLSRKLQALRQIRFLYGDECFIYDLVKLFLSLATKTAVPIVPRTGSAFGRLDSLSTQINAAVAVDSTLANVFILSCGSCSLIAPETFLSKCFEGSSLLSACRKVLAVCNNHYAANLRKILRSRGIFLDGIENRNSSGVALKC